MGEDLADGPWFGDERDQTDVAATRQALERKLLPRPGHEFGPGNPGGVVRAGLLLRVAAAFQAVTVTPVPACHGIALLANVPDRQRRDGRPKRAIRREDTVIAMPVFARRRDEIGEPVEKLKRREFDDAARAGRRGLSSATPPDPVGGFVAGQHVANATEKQEPGLVTINPAVRRGLSSRNVGQ